MAANIAPLQPFTLAAFLPWGSQRELVVPTAGAKVRKRCPHPEKKIIQP